MKKIRKFLSAFLSVLMVVSIVAPSAAAAGENILNGTEPIWYGGTYVVNNAKETTLQQDVTVVGDTTLVLKSDLEFGGGVNAITINSGATLTIKSDNNSELGGCCIINNGTLNVKGGKLTTTSYRDNAVINNGTMTVTGGNIWSDECSPVVNNGTLKISGGEVACKNRWVEQLCEFSALVLNGGTCEITGTARVLNQGYEPTIDVQGGSLKVTGGKIQQLSEGNQVVNVAAGVPDSNIKILGGTVNGGVSGLTINLKLDANGGTFSAGTTKQISCDARAEIAGLSWETPTKEGYLFLGWSEKQTGKDVLIDTPIKDTTLYASWMDETRVTIENISVIGKSYEDGGEAIQAFDGLKNTIWSDVYNGTSGWLAFKTPSPYSIVELTVSHAEMAGEESDYNTVAYSLQILKNPAGYESASDKNSYLADASNWKDIVAVSENTEAEVVSTVTDAPIADIYRLNVTESCKIGFNKAVRIAEIALVGSTLPPKPETPSTEIPYENITAVVDGGGYNLAYKVFDGNKTYSDTNWHSNKTTQPDGAWFTFKVNEPVAISKMEVYTGDREKIARKYSVLVLKDEDALFFAPDENEFLSDSNNWEEIITVDNASKEDPDTINIRYPITAQYYRFRAERGGAAIGDNVNISEIVLYNRDPINDPVIISFDGNGAQGIMKYREVERGTNFILPKSSFTPETDYKFAGWEINGVRYNAGEEVILTTDVTATAIWEPITYVDISFNPGVGAEGKMPQIKHHNIDLSIELPNCLFKGAYKSVFTGWKIAGDETLYQPGDVIKVKDNPIITAQWKTLSGKTLSNGTRELSDSCYIVTGTLTFAERIEIKGDVIIELSEGAVLTARKGIHVPKDATLKIIGNGTLNAIREGNADATIGGNSNEVNGDIIIEGGTINSNIEIGAEDYCYGAGIGGGWGTPAGFIHISGGNVTSKGGNAAAIGGGNGCGAGDIYITGGVVNASLGGKYRRASCIGVGAYGDGGSVTISGGVVNAVAGNEFAIGPTDNKKMNFSTGENGNALITLNKPISGGCDRTKFNGVISENSGSTYTVYGNTEIAQTHNFSDENKVIIPQNSSLTVPQGKTLEIGTQIEGAGKIINNGIFKLKAENTDALTFEGTGKFYRYINNTIGINFIYPEGIDNTVYSGEQILAKSTIAPKGEINGFVWEFLNVTVVLEKGGQNVNEIRDSGEYLIKFVAKDNSEVSKKFTILKAETTVTVPEIIFDIRRTEYTPNAHAVNTEISGVWAYKYEGVDGTEYPETNVAPTKIGTYLVKAYYESNNYVGSGSGKVILKGNPTYVVPKNLVALKGQTLADVIIPAGSNKGTFQWMNSAEQVRAGANNYKAKFIPNDQTFYYDVENVDIEITVKDYVMISFSAGDGIGTMNPVIVENGSSFILPEGNLIAPKLQKFAKWDLGEAGTTIKVTGNMIIEAQYENGCEVLDEGTCSSDGNVKWVLTSDGRLNILGIGRMLDYGSGKAPWARYSDKVNSVNVFSTVTYVGENTFVDCVNLGYVRISNSEVEINANAFSDLTGVTVIANNGYTNQNLVNAEFAKIGDVNSDTSVTAEDYSAAVNEAIGSNGKLEGVSFEIADVNNDGVVDVLDLTVIKTASLNS